MRLVFFVKKDDPLLIKSKRIYVKASTKGRRQKKAYFRLDPRNKKAKRMSKLEMEKKVNQFKRDYSSYKKGRDSGIVVETEPMILASSLTPKQILDIRVDHSGQKMNKFIFDNTALMNQIASRHYNDRMSSVVGFDDLVQTAREAAYRSIMKFDLSRKTDTPGMFMNYMMAAMDNGMNVLVGKTQRKKDIKDPLSLDQPIMSGEEEEEARERIELAASRPEMQGRSIQQVDYKNAVATMKRFIHHDKAKKILDLMSKGLSKAQIAELYAAKEKGYKKLPYKKQRKRVRSHEVVINRIVIQHIRPLAEKYLKSETNEMMLDLMKSIQGDDEMKLVFFLKSKKVWVKPHQSGGHTVKGHYTTKKGNSNSGMTKEQIANSEMLDYKDLSKRDKKIYDEQYGTVNGKEKKEDNKKTKGESKNGGEKLSSSEFTKLFDSAMEDLEGEMQEREDQGEKKRFTRTDIEYYVEGNTPLSHDTEDGQKMISRLYHQFKNR